MPLGPPAIMYKTPFQPIIESPYYFPRIRRNKMKTIILIMTLLATVYAAPTADASLVEVCLPLCLPEGHECPAGLRSMKDWSGCHKCCVDI